MRVFIIDTTHMSPELQGGLIGIVGSEQPSPEEKQQCVDTVSHYATDGWAIAADPHTPIGRLAALTTETARVPFVNLNGPRSRWFAASSIVSKRSAERNPAAIGGSPFWASLPSVPDDAGRSHAGIENGGR